MANYNERQLNNGEQGEGSGLNADKVDNSEGSELGNTIDGSSISENSNGEIQADPSVRGIGWTKITEESGSSVKSLDVTLSETYKEYKAVIKVEQVSANSYTDIGLRLNNNNIDFRYARAGGTQTTGDPYVYLFNLANYTTDRAREVVYISETNAYGDTQGQISNVGGGNSYGGLLMGYANVNSFPIDEINIVQENSNDLDIKVEVYGR